MTRVLQTLFFLTFQPSHKIRFFKLKLLTWHKIPGHYIFLYVLVPTIIDYKSQIARIGINYQQKRPHFSSFSFTSKTEIGELQVTRDHTQKGLKMTKLNWSHPVHLQHMSSTTMKTATQYISKEEWKKPFILTKLRGYPKLKSLLCNDGVDM